MRELSNFQGECLQTAEVRQDQHVHEPAILANNGISDLESGCKL